MNGIKIAKVIEKLIELAKETVLGSELNDVQLTKNFNLKEFCCPCCGVVKINPELVRRLQKLRDEIGKPVIINSGYRCPKRNREVGGAERSQHLFGNAADLKVAGMSMNELADIAEKYFQDGGLGRYKDGHIHVDVRGKRARWND